LADEEDYDDRDYSYDDSDYRDGVPYEDEEPSTSQGRKLPYWAGASICALWTITLALAGVWINIKWRLNSTTNTLLGLVGFGLFWLGGYLVGGVTKDYSE